MRVLSILLFLTLLVATPAVPPVARESAQATEGATEEEAVDTEEILEEFVPTEELPADSAISFPVDI